MENPGIAGLVVGRARGLEAVARQNIVPQEPDRCESE